MVCDGDRRILRPRVYLMMNSEAPKAAFNIDEQLTELDKLIEDRSCHNARSRWTLSSPRPAPVAHKTAVQQREARLKQCQRRA